MLLLFQDICTIVLHCHNRTIIAITVPLIHAAVVSVSVTTLQLIVCVAKHSAIYCKCPSGEYIMDVFTSLRLYISISYITYVS